MDDNFHFIYQTLYDLIKIFTEKINRMQTINIPQTLPETGYKVPVVATFIGFKNVPLIAVAYNNISSSLTLFEDHIEYKVCRTRRYNYSKIDSVGVFRTIGTENIKINFRNSLFSFSGNLFEKENLIELLKFFQRKHLKLTGEAAALLNES